MYNLNREVEEQESLLGIAGSPAPGWQARKSLAQRGLASKRERFGRANVTRTSLCAASISDRSM